MYFTDGGYPLALQIARSYVYHLHATPPPLTSMQMWPLVLAFFSSKAGHSSLIDENSQSSMVMVLLLRLAKLGFFPSYKNYKQ